MTMQMLALVNHPTVIAPAGANQPFHGWGVRIG